MMNKIDEEVFNTIINNIALKPNMDMRVIYNNGLKHSSIHNIDEIPESKAKRYMVNYIRHSYTNYNNSLKYIRQLNDKKDTQYHIYKNKVLYMISLKYPYLSDECINQMTNLKMVHKV